MIKAGLPFEEALKEAQENGYAEKDPSADIEGHDACRKICILAALAFGRHIYPNQVPTEGITGVSSADVDYAAAAGKKIKLLGRAVKDEKTGIVRAYVAPHLIDSAAPLAGVEDVFNAITVRGDAIGEVMFYGRGAGKLPTASAVVADVIDAARHIKNRKYLAWEAGGADAAGDAGELESRWYIRVQGTEEVLSAALGTVEILKRDGQGNESACITAEPMSRIELEHRLCGIQTISRMRVLN